MGNFRITCQKIYSTWCHKSMARIGRNLCAQGTRLKINIRCLRTPGLLRITKEWYHIPLPKAEHTQKNIFSTLLARSPQVTLENNKLDAIWRFRYHVKWLWNLRSFRNAYILGIMLISISTAEYSHWCNICKMLNYNMLLNASI